LQVAIRMSSTASHATDASASLPTRRRRRHESGSELKSSAVPVDAPFVANSSDPPVRRAPTGSRSRRFRRVTTALAAAVLAIAGWGTSAPIAGADTSFTFVGSGWGHGVGMSQWGARGLAERGLAAPQILNSYYQGTTMSTAPDLGVRVLLGTAPSFTFTPTAPVGYSVLFGAGLGTSAAPVTAAATGGAISLSGGVSAVSGGTVAVSFAGAPMRMSPPGYRYNRGTIALIPTGTGSIQAVLSISMREYLYGLGEMPSSWPAASLQAQAIAGRTYAQKKVETTHGSGTYDIVGGLPDQSYLGFDKEGAAMGLQWVAAVESTNNQVVRYGSGLIDAVYSASSGGHTENSENVWVAAVPYLRGVADPTDLTGGNPNASWSRTYTGGQLGAWFGLGQVTSVQILGPLGASGRVDKATIRLVGTGGTRDVSGTSFRSTVNSAAPSAQLMSTRFGVGAAPGGSTSPSPPPPPPPPNALPGGSITVAKADGRTIVMAGTALDDQGAPRVRVVSTMGPTVAVREAHSANGQWLAVWSGGKGTRHVCVTLLDNPTGQSVGIGCRDITVK